MQSDSILFDVNETLLDLSLLRARFRTHFGTDTGVPAWFARTLHASTVCVVTGVKSDFRRLAEESLRRTAAEAKVDLQPRQVDEILGAFARLPPHPDVRPALERLRQSGLRTIAFSNSSVALLQTQMQQAELDGLLDAVVSVQHFASFKPDPSVYRGVARLVERPVQALCLVACHDWDCHGALSSGMRAAFVRRGPAPYGRLYRRPELEADRLDVLAEALVERARR